MYKTLKPLILNCSPKGPRVDDGVVDVCLCHSRCGCVVRSFYAVRSELEVEVAGLTFPNPVGLAAGFDKDARWLKQMRVLGFGFVEIGTVTPLPQDGNPQPRLFRLPADKGIINRMGFNNSGMVAAAPVCAGAAGAHRWRQHWQEQDYAQRPAESDYIQCFNALYDYVDYFVVNVSSPTRRACGNCRKRNRSSGSWKPSLPSAPSGPLRPIFLKIAPD